MKDRTINRFHIFHVYACNETRDMTTIKVTVTHIP